MDNSYEDEQYEMVWKSGFDYFCRTRNVLTNQVRIQKISPKWEYFERNQNGEKTFILDPSVSLTEKSFYQSNKAKEYKGLFDSLGKEIFGGQPPQYQYIREHFFQNGKESNIRIFYLDIETMSSDPLDRSFPDPQLADKPVSQIQIYDNYTDKIIILSLDKMKDEQKFKHYTNLIFKHYYEEKDLFNDFIKLLENLKPTVITAWNSDFFDIPYLTNRAKKLSGVNYRRLSPINKITEIKTSEGLNYSWEGIYLIDMMKAYKKFTFKPQVSYSLENITKVELKEGEGKVDYGEFNDIIDFYHGDIDKFIEYSIQDVVSLKKLEDKLKLIDLMKILAIMMGINIEDTFGTVKPWGQYLTNLAMKEGLIMPFDRHSHLEKTIVGGYVRQPKKGKHNWLISVDVNSMYPLLGMRAFNMSPETYVNDYELPQKLKKLRNKFHTHENEEAYLIEENLKEIREISHSYDVSFGMNAFFRRDKEGIIPAIVGKIYTERKEAKSRMLMYKALKARLSQNSFGKN